MTVPTETPQWAGPARFLPPPEPIVRVDSTRHFSGITYAVPFGYRPLQLDLWVPDTAAPAPLVVYIHGGGWMFGDRRFLPETLRPNQLFDAILEAGLSVATVDYRHALEARFPAQLHDVKAAVRYLRSHSGELVISTERICVMGESAGGHLAALVGLTAHRADLEGNLGVVGPGSTVDAVVDWYGPANMENMPRQTLPPEIAAKLPPELVTPPEDQLLAGLDEQSKADASPITHVTAAAPPFLLVHGTADWLVPYQQSRSLATALEAAGASVRLVPVDGAEHIFLGCEDIDAVVRLSVDYLADHLLEKNS
jgi:acetyl esterase/lipase